MEKKTISVHAFTVHIYTIALVVLVFLLVVLGLKYAHLKWSVKNYTQSTIWMNSQAKPTGQVNEYAAIIAASASDFVAPKDLQSYITTLSKKLHRDIVVMNSSQKITADTVLANVGTIYNSDPNQEIRLTLSDGQNRVFEEKSADYPNGILEIAVPLKNANGQITGAVLISESQISN